MFVPTTTGARKTHVRNIAYPALGLALRSDRNGAESDLIRSFLAALEWDVPPGFHLTVLEQPKLETGFPDIVCVLWDIERTTSWSERPVLWLHVTMHIIRDSNGHF